MKKKVKYMGLCLQIFFIYEPLKNKILYFLKF